MNYFIFVGKKEIKDGELSSRHIYHLKVENKEIAKRVVEGINKTKRYTATFFLFGIIGI